MTTTLTVADRIEPLLARPFVVPFLLLCLLCVTFLVVTGTLSVVTGAPLWWEVDSGTSWLVWRGGW